MRQDRITEDEVGAMLEEAFEGEPFNRIEPPPRFKLFFRGTVKTESFLERMKRFLVIPSVPRRLVFSGAAVAILLVALVPLMPDGRQPVYRDDALIAPALDLPQGRLQAFPESLQWPTMAGAVSYRVELTDQEGVLLWSTKAGTNRIAPPADLSAGKAVGSEYVVLITGYGQDGSVAGKDRSRFMVLP